MNRLHIAGEFDVLSRTAMPVRHLSNALAGRLSSTDWGTPWRRCTRKDGMLGRCRRT